jgi:opacity protein-like surface antigen
MKNILLTSIAAVMATFAANASVAPYVSLHAGYDNYKFTFIAKDAKRFIEGLQSEFAYDVSGAIGVKYDITSSLGIRGEIEYNFTDARHVSEKTSIDMDWLRAHTVLANGYIDFKTAMGLNPYFSAGIGYRWNHHANGGVLPQRRGLAYQFGTGISYDINKKVAVDFGYRYLTSFYDWEDSTGFKYILHDTSHQFRIGATYAF